ncbi:hypothetical protein V1478_000072 [Vespula squamosa]|uniref:Uncharacterized protein n=1 Tax=Vespula squamosa TaxID=30214 RepID=A0ABD2CA06_VESSQ
MYNGMMNSFAYSPLSIERVRTQREETESYHCLCFSENIVFDSIDDLSYLDHDDSGNKFCANPCWCLADDRFSKSRFEFENTYSGVSKGKNASQAHKRLCAAYGNKP